MKKRNIVLNNHGSASGVTIFVLGLMIAGFLVLLIGQIIEPFLNLMASTDDTIDSEIAKPRSYMSTFAQYIWPKGVLIIVFLALSVFVLMNYQKKNYMGY